MTTDLAFDRSWFIQLKKADISHLDGWKEFVHDRDTYRPPPRFARDEYESLGRDDRDLYNLARRVANVNLPKHETPMAAKVIEQIEPVLQANIFSTDPGVRAGIFVSADGGLGKSTLIRELAARFDGDVRGFSDLAPSLFPCNDRWVPVAWVTVPPKLSIRNLAKAILNFYGAPYRKSDSDSELTSRVENTIRDCDTRLLILDDITRYKDHEPDRFASDWIRNVMETSVSIIAMGVDVRGSGILYDGKTNRQQRLRTQTARRFTSLDMEPFSYRTDEDIRHWIAHLKAIEADLFLLDKSPGMLSDDLAEYLYEHTAGVIGVLTRWVSITAMKAVGRPERMGGECLTMSDFDDTPVPTVESLKEDLDVQAPAQRAKPTKRGRNSSYDQPRRDRTGAA